MFDTFPMTERGGREVNQDCYDSAQLSSATCWVLADGLGGHSGGELASRAAVDAALQSFRQYPELSTAAVHLHVLAAQCAVVNLQLEQPALGDMRTTIVVAVSDSVDMLWAHVGDTRLYHFRAGRFVSRTLDHSVPQMLVESGEIQPNQIPHHPDRNRLLRALGEHAEIRPAIGNKTRLAAGDAFLLCTDGFWEYVPEGDLERDLRGSRTPRDWIAKAKNRLLASVSQDGVRDQDNYSAMAIFVTGRSGMVLPAFPLAVKIGAALFVCVVLLLSMIVVARPSLPGRLRSMVDRMVHPASKTNGSPTGAAPEAAMPAAPTAAPPPPAKPAPAASPAPKAKSNKRKPKHAASPKQDQSALLQLQEMAATRQSYSSFDPRRNNG